MKPEATRRWRRPAASIAVVAVLVSAGVVIDRATHGSAKPRAAVTVSTSTATVVRSDLAETTPVNGTVGYATPVTLVEPPGTPTSALTQAQQAAASAQDNVAADQTAATDSNAADAQAAAQAEQAVSAAEATAAADAAQLQTDQAALDAARLKAATDCQGDQAGASSGSGAGSPSPCATDTSTVSTDADTVAGDKQKVTSDQTAVQNAQSSVTSNQQKSAQSEHQVQAKLAADQLALGTAESSLASAEAASTSYQSTSRYTGLPVVGQLVKPGQVLWSVDGSPVALASRDADGVAGVHRRHGRRSRRRRPRPGPRRRW